MKLKNGLWSLKLAKFWPKMEMTSRWSMGARTLSYPSGTTIMRHHASSNVTDLSCAPIYTPFLTSVKRLIAKSTCSRAIQERSSFSVKPRKVKQSISTFAKSILMRARLVTSFPTKMSPNTRSAMTLNFTNSCCQMKKWVTVVKAWLGSINHPLKCLMQVLMLASLWHFHSPSLALRQRVQYWTCLAWKIRKKSSKFRTLKSLLISLVTKRLIYDPRVNSTFCQTQIYRQKRHWMIFNNSKSKHKSKLSR